MDYVQNMPSYRHFRPLLFHREVFIFSVFKKERRSTINLNNSSMFLAKELQRILTCLLTISMITNVAFAANVDRRPSSRIVTTKYGAVRGLIVTLPNRNLQQVEVFLGM